MGTLRGYLDFARRDTAVRSVPERIGDFAEFLVLPDAAGIKRQAARCMECPTPFCYGLGCPLTARIPEWNDLTLRQDIRAAYASLTRTNPFPEITGRLCPALCESSCSLAINLAPVTIKQIELYISETAFARGYVQANPPRERRPERVAIVGSGPAGLAAAQSLNQAGFNVAVYEKNPALGGMLRYGAPDFKLPKWVLDRRLTLLAQEGIAFAPNTEVGRDIGVDFLQRDYDALLLCPGVGKPRDLVIPGRQAAGIHFALDYLTQANHLVAGLASENDMIHARGKRVVVLGGGDTGSDCVGTAIRQGARQVTQVEILPRPEEWTKPFNPAWPDYPSILRTSSSQAEGCVREFALSAREFLTRDGHLTGVRCVRVEWFCNEDGTRTMREIPGSEMVIDADLAILALGFGPVERAPWLAELAIEYDARGNILVDRDNQTDLPWVFVAGDAATGPSLVCRAIHQGLRAADAIGAYLG